jgi:UDP:flavonoid glycosyltransferase YjiC (YdhE family)
MVAAGHEVTVLGQPCMRDRAVGAGATFETFADFGDYATDVAIEEQLDLVLTSLAGVGTGEQLVEVAESVGADAVVVDCNLAAAAAAAEALPVPSAVLFHSMYATFTDVWFAELWPLLAESVNAARSAFGVPEAGGWPGVFAGHARLLAAVPESFDAPVAAVPPALRHHGFLVPSSDGVAPPPLAPAQAGEPTVVVSLSTTHLGQADLLARIVAGVGSRTVRGLVTTGGQADPAALGAPDHVQVFDWLPHSAVLPETDVVVTHGGLGTCAGALSHGVPLVCLPLGRDQHLNAARVEAVGAGISLPSAASPDAIADALDLVLGDPAYAAAAQRVAAESRAAGGAPAALTDLESLL